MPAERGNEESGVPTRSVGTRNPGDLILEPFLGSGTTAVVALELGRSVVGFELREDYGQIAKERIETFLREKMEAVKLQPAPLVSDAIGKCLPMYPT